MSVTMITYPKNLEGSISIIGDKGSAKVGGVAVNELNTLSLKTMKMKIYKNIITSQIQFMDLVTIFITKIC